MASKLALNTFRVTGRHYQPLRYTNVILVNKVGLGSNSHRSIGKPMPAAPGKSGLELVFDDDI